VEGFLSDVQAGNWDAVLTACQSLQLPVQKLMALYEQVAEDCQINFVVIRTVSYMSAVRVVYASNEDLVRMIGCCNQVILELLELREVEVARAMLRQTELMLSMKQEQPG
jgi:hypothetical protein